MEEATSLLIFNGIKSLDCKNLKEFFNSLIDNCYFENPDKMYEGLVDSHHHVMFFLKNYKLPKVLSLNFAMLLHYALEIQTKTQEGEVNADIMNVNEKIRLTTFGSAISVHTKMKIIVEIDKTKTFTHECIREILNENLILHGEISYVDIFNAIKKPTTVTGKLVNYLWRIHSMNDIELHDLKMEIKKWQVFPLYLLLEDEKFENKWYGVN